MARDTSVSSGQIRTISGLPAMDAAQAGRWARGLLMMHNRQAETLTIDQALNVHMTALTRVDITGGTPASGQWIAGDVEHDFVNSTTRATLFRVVDTII